MNTNNELIKNYLEQDSSIPAQQLMKGQLMEDEQIVLYSHLDLDESTKFCARWLVLTDKRLLLMEQQEMRTRILESVVRENIVRVVEKKTLGMIQWLLVGESGQLIFRPVQFTHRQKDMMEKLRYAIEEKVRRTEHDATNVYQETVLKPILDARNNLADEHKDALLRLLHYLRPYKKDVAIGMGAAMIGALISLVPAYLSGRLLDDVVRPYQDQSLYGKLAMHLGMIFLLALASTYLLREFFIWQRLKRMSIIGEKVASDLRQELFAHIQTLGADFFARKHSGSLISRIGSDTDRIWDFIAFGVVEVTVAIGTLLGLSVVLILRDWKLGLAMVSPLPIILYAIYWQGERMKKLFIRAWRKWSVVTAHLSDVIPGIQVVKVFGQEKREVRKFEQKNADFTEETFAFHQTWTSFWPLLMLSVHVTTIFMWALATPRLLSPVNSPGHLSSGVFVSFLLYASLMVWPLEIIGQVSRMLNRALSSAYRIFEVLDTRNPMEMSGEKVHPEKCEGDIQFKNVFYSYDKLRPILKRIDLHISPGEFVGLVGASGSGKSTITKLLARIYDPTVGKVLIDGHDVKELEPSWLKKNVGMVLQEPYLFFGSIRENIAYGVPHANEAEIIAAAKAANAHDFIMKLPSGYDTVVGERGQTLSGGERQRVSIARAILHDPKILILDEATSAVDSETERKIQGALDKLVLNRTTIAIAHRLSTLRKANRLFVIDNGQVVEVGTHQELMQIPGGKYATLYQQQYAVEEVVWN